MYLEHFKLNELPFRLSPDPAFLYLSKHHARAKAYMESTIWFTDGFVVITGEIGSGKTTLLETFLRELEKDVVVAQVAQTQVSPIEFLQAVLVQFGFSPFKMRKAELIATLNQFLVEQYAAGRKVLLIVDEAQNLSNRVLEEIRMLSGVETTKEKVLRIILAGQPELNEKLDSPELVQLVQRVRLRFHLTALTPEETEAYILHRLEVAGAHGRQFFSPETMPVIFRYSGGVPRLVNTLCDTALMIAFSSGQPAVGMTELKAAIDELQWIEFAARTNRFKIGDLHAGAGAEGSRARRSARAHHRRARRRTRGGAAAAHRAAPDRPHGGQRHPDRKQVREPPSLPDHDDRRWQHPRGPQQHERRVREEQARAPPSPERRRRRRARQARDHVPRRALGPCAQRRAGVDRRPPGGRGIRCGRFGCR